MNYKRANNILLALIIVINLYLIAAPLLPNVMFWWQQRDSAKQTALQHKLSVPSTKSTGPNQLILPSILLDEKIVEGPVSSQIMNLRKGVWRWPKGSTPDKGGNTTFIGHRFTYYNPVGVFYNLDKLKRGDSIGVIWNGKPYQYRVSSIKQVVPSDTSILKQTKDSRLTIYTCTPLWHPTHRLVITAKLIPSGGTS